MTDYFVAGKTVDMMRRWRVRLEADGLARKSIRDYMRWAGRLRRRWPSLFSSSFGECVEIASASLRRQAYSPTTIHHFQCIMARFSRDIFGWDAEQSSALIRARAVRPALPCPDAGQVADLVRALSGAHRLIALICYCCGTRISEAHGLRLGDVDLVGNLLTVRVGKGAKGRRIPMPPELVSALRSQADYSVAIAMADIARGDVYAPLDGDDWRARPGLARDAASWPLFPQRSLVWDARISRFVRVFMIPQRTEKAFAVARRAAGITIHVTPHRLRDAYAVHSLLAGVPVPVIQARLGHANMETTAKYLSYLVSEDGLAQFPGLRLFKGGARSA